MMLSLLHIAATSLFNILCIQFFIDFLCYKFYYFKDTPFGELTREILRSLIYFTLLAFPLYGVIVGSFILFLSAMAHIFPLLQKEFYADVAIIILGICTLLLNTYLAIAIKKYALSKGILGKNPFLLHQAVCWGTIISSIIIILITLAPLLAIINSCSL